MGALIWLAPFGWRGLSEVWQGHQWVAFLIMMTTWLSEHWLVAIGVATTLLPLIAFFAVVWWGGRTYRRLEREQAARGRTLLQTSAPRSDYQPPSFSAPAAKGFRQRPIRYPEDAT